MSVWSDVHSVRRVCYIGGSFFAIYLCVTKQYLQVHWFPTWSSWPPNKGSSKLPLIVRGGMLRLIWKDKEIYKNSPKNIRKTHLWYICKVCFKFISVAFFKQTSCGNFAQWCVYTCKSNYRDANYMFVWFPNLVPVQTLLLLEPLIRPHIWHRLHTGKNKSQTLMITLHILNECGSDNLLSPCQGSQLFRTLGPN